MSPRALNPRLQAWRDGGELVAVGDHNLFTRSVPGSGPTLVFLHGYPSSSYDWQPVLELLTGRRATTFDFLGFGLSDKPRDHVYSLLTQADDVEAVVRRCHRSEPIVLVAHDMGTSVATELLARELEGRLSFMIAAVLLFNGSMVIEKASLTVSQKLLRSAIGPLVARLSNEPTFRAQFARLFSPAHPLTDEQAADQWDLVSYNDGHRLLDRLIYYIGERTTFASRWHGALRDWRGRLELAWAGRDPVCTEAVLQAVLELRPDAPVTRLPDLGHYPQLEDAEAVAAIISSFAAGVS